MRIARETLIAVNAQDELSQALASVLELVQSFPERTLTEPTTLKDFESRLADRLSRAGREAVSQAMKSTEPSTAIVEVDGAFYRRMRDATTGNYLSLFGPINLARFRYRQVGVHNGPTLVPMELATGVLDGMTPAAASALGRLAQVVPSREAAELCVTLHVLGADRNRIHRGAEALGRRWEEHREDGEDHLVRSLIIPKEAVSVSVSVDRASIPMEEPRKRPPGRPRRNAPKRPIEVNWRMNYCGTLTLHDGKGKALWTKRYARMPGEDNGFHVEESLRCDLEFILSRRPGLKVAGVSDGAAEMLNMLGRILEGFDSNIILIDFWHAMEYLAAAIDATGRTVKKHLPKWKSMFHHSDLAAGTILRTLRRWKAELGTAAPEELTDAIRYLKNHRHQMTYASARKAGLPIGSGIVEASCKSIVGMRMKRPGARWKPNGGQAILHLRALATSSQWEDAMTFLESTATRTITPIPHAA